MVWHEQSVLIISKIQSWFFGLPKSYRGESGKHVQFIGHVSMRTHHLPCGSVDLRPGCAGFSSCYRRCYFFLHLLGPKKRWKMPTWIWKSWHKLPPSYKCNKNGQINERSAIRAPEIHKIPIKVENKSSNLRIIIRHRYRIILLHTILRIRLELLLRNQLHSRCRRLQHQRNRIGLHPRLGSYRLLCNHSRQLQFHPADTQPPRHPLGDESSQKTICRHRSLTINQHQITSRKRNQEITYWWPYQILKCCIRLPQEKRCDCTQQDQPRHQTWINISFCWGIRMRQIHHHPTCAQILRPRRRNYLPRWCWHQGVQHFLAETAIWLRRPRTISALGDHFLKCSGGKTWYLRKIGLESPRPSIGQYFRRSTSQRAELQCRICRFPSQRRPETKNCNRKSPDKIAQNIDSGWSYLRPRQKKWKTDSADPEQIVKRTNYPDCGPSSQNNYGCW